MIQYFLVIFLDGSPTCYRAFMGHMFYITNICFTIFIINLIPVCIYLWVNLNLHIILKPFISLYIHNVYIYIYFLPLNLCYSQLPSNKWQSTMTILFPGQSTSKIPSNMVYSFKSFKSYSLTYFENMSMKLFYVSVYLNDL